MPGRSAGSQGSPVLLRQAQARTLTHARRECRCVHAAAPTTAHVRVDTPGDVFAHAVTGAAHLRSVERGHEQHADSEPHAPRAGAHATRQAARVPLRPMMWWKTLVPCVNFQGLLSSARRVGETGEGMQQRRSAACHLPAARGKNYVHGKRADPTPRQRDAGPPRFAAAAHLAVLFAVLAEHNAAGFRLSTPCKFRGGDALMRSSALAVDVRVVREIAVGADAARTAWLTHVWSAGGGLPVLVRHRTEGVRLLGPIMMEETLMPCDDLKGPAIRYNVSDGGLLAGELEPGSHTSTVRFLPIDGTAGGGCRMIWDVSFETRKRRWLWEAVTRTMITAAANNFASHVATPLLYSRTTSLSATSRLDALEKWLSFVWREGGGLPLPTPVHQNEHSRLIVPPFLAERIVTVDRELCEICYTVDNPGLLTYPVHTHQGRVAFFEGGSPGHVEMVWDVEIRPLQGCRGLVQAFTTSVITTLCRNIKVHMREPGARVHVASPRSASSKVLTSVRKDSWLGGVRLLSQTTE